MSMRKAVVITFLAMLALGMMPLAAQDAPVTMTFWVRSTSSLISTLVDEWNATHDNQVELTEIPAADFVTKFR